MGLYVVIGLILVISVLLVVVVLAQNSKGGGLSSSFGGSGAASVIGVQRTNDLLEKLTWGFAGAIAVLCISTGFLIEEPVQDNSSPNIDAASRSFTPPVQQQPTQATPPAGDSGKTIVVDSTDINGAAE